MWCQATSLSLLPLPAPYLTDPDFSCMMKLRPMRVRYLIAVVAVLGIVGSPLAMCAAEAMASTADDVTCCQSSHHECGTAMKAAQCCTPAPQTLQVSGVERPDHTSTPVLMPMHPAALASVPDTQAQRADSLRQPIFDTSPPAGFRFSVLLI